MTLAAPCGTLNGSLDGCTAQQTRTLLVCGPASVSWPLRRVEEARVPELWQGNQARQHGARGSTFDGPGELAPHG
jgi:hypothetical protein